MVFYTLAIGLLAVPSTASAQTAGVPATIGYNGRLFNSSGTALSGTYYFWVDLESALTGGTNLASNIQAFADADGDGVLDDGSEEAITVTNGFFTFEVPISTDIADFANNVYLEIKVHTAEVVGSAETLSPRVKVTKTPYAIVSQAIERSSADPTTGFEGRMYYDTDEDEIKFYDGTADSWVTLASTLDDAYNNFGSSAQIITVDDATTGIEFSVEAAGNYTVDLQSTGDFVVQDAGSTWAQFTDAQAFDVDGTGAISLDADAASNFNTSAGDLSLDAEAGSLNLDGGEAAADAVNIDASNAAGGIDIDAGTGGIAIDSTGTISLDGADDMNFTLATDAAAEDLTIAVTGATDSSVFINSSGTGSDAIAVNASAGGLTLDAASAVSIDGAGASNFSTSTGSLTLATTAGGTSSSVILQSVDTSTDAIYLDADGGAGAGIYLDAYDGTNNTTGRVTLDGAAVQINTYGSIAGIGNAGFDVNVGDSGTLALSTTDGALSFTGGGASGSISVTSANNSITLDTQTASSSISLGTSGVARTINIGTGTGADTVNFGTGADQFNLVSTETSNDPFDITFNSITTANGIDFSATSLTTGNALNMTLAGTTGSALNITDSAQDGASALLDLNLTDATVTAQSYVLRGTYSDNDDSNADFILFEDAGGTQFSVAHDGATVIAGSADGTSALAITAGDLDVTDGDLDGSGGDFNWILDSADDANFTKAAAAAATEEGLEIDFTAGAGDGSDVYTALKVDVASANHAAASDIVYGIRIDDLASADTEGTEIALDIGSGWDTGLSLGSSFQLDDDTALALGTSSDAQFIWETADLNANALHLVLPDGDATDVPVFAIGDASMTGDLGLFDGITNNTFAIVSDDAGDYVSLDVNNTGNATITTSTGDLFVGIAGGNFAPTGDNSTALGVSGAQWADLFLGLGAVINFNEGDVTLTQAVNKLTLDGGFLDIGGLTAGTVDGDNDLGVAGDFEVDGVVDFDGSVDFDGTTFDADGSGLVSLTSTSDANQAVLLSTTAGGMDITVAGDTAGDDLDITATGTATEIRITTASTTADAFTLTTSAGGADVNVADAFDLDTTDGAIQLTAGGAANGDVTIVVGDDYSNTVTGDYLDTVTGTYGIDAGGATTIDSDAGLVLGGSTITAAADGGAFDLDATGALSLNSSAAAINIGNDAVAQAINIGTGAAARTITYGNATGATAINFDAGTGGVDFDLVATGAMSIDGDLVVVGGAADGNTADGDGDLYVVSDFEVDGVVDLDGSVDFDGTAFDVASSGAFSIDGSGASSNVSLASTGNGQDLTIALTGANDSSLFLTSAGTGADAVRVNASAGGIDIDADSVITIDTTNDELQIDTGTADVVIAGNEDGTAALTLTAGDLAVTDGDLTLSSGDFNVGLDDGDTANIDGDGSPTADILQIGSGDTSATDGVDALQLSFGVSAASGNVIDITPAYADATAGATSETYNVIDIDAFTATQNAAGDTGVINALNVGNLTQTETAGTITATALNIGTGWDVGMALTTGTTIQFVDAGETISGDGTDLTLASGADINLTATADVNLGANVGLVISADDAEKIEGDGTDISFSVGAAGDINIPTDIGLKFGDDGEGVEGDGTDLTLSSGADINLTATTDINIPGNVGLTFSDDGEKIEGDGTDLTISSGGDVLIAATGANLAPSADDGAALGISGQAFSDLFLASGGVINFNAGDITLTHSADALDFAGGDFNVTIDDGDTVNIAGDGSSTTSLFDLTQVASAADADALTLSLTQSDGTAAGDNLVGIDMGLTGNDADGDMFAIRVTTAATANAAAGTYEAVLWVDNEEETAGSMVDAVFIGSSGGDGGIIDAIDASDSNIDNAINIGTNNILGGNGDIFLVGSTADATYTLLADTDGETIILDADDGTGVGIFQIGTAANLDTLDIITNDDGADDVDITGSVTISNDLLVTDDTTLNGDLNITLDDGDTINIAGDGTDTANILNIVGDGVSDAQITGLSIGITGANGTGGTTKGLSVSATGEGDNGADIMYGAHIDLAAAGSGTNIGLQIDATAEWTSDIAFGSTTALIGLATGGGASLTFAESVSGDTLLTITENGDEGDVVATGNFTADLVTSSEGTFAGANSETLLVGASDAVFDFTRNDTGAVTITASDDDATAALTVDPGGAADLTLGSADVTQINLTTDDASATDVNVTGSVTISNDLAVTDNTALEGIIDIGTQESMADNDLTPSVATGSFFVSAADSDTITAFDDAVAGQIWIIEHVQATDMNFDCDNTDGGGDALQCGAADIQTQTGDTTMWYSDGTTSFLINWVDETDTQTGADLAEWFPANENVEAADVLVMKGNPEHVEKSTSAYQQGLMGVVSTQPGFILGENGAEFNALVALAGRVPVKISAENGPIEIGDYLTSSATLPGYAMKATEAGAVIGMAMESFSSGTGEIVVKVDNMWYTPPTAQSSELQGGSSQAVAVADTVSATDAVFEGSVTVAEHIYGSHDVAGRIRMAQGEIRVYVEFETPYDHLPIVTFSSRSNSEAAQGAWISDESEDGFWLNRPDAGTLAQVEFNWIAIGVEDAQVTVSDLDGGWVSISVDDPNGPSAPAPSTPEEEDVVTESSESGGSEEAETVEETEEPIVEEEVVEEPTEEIVEEEPAVEEAAAEETVEETAEPAPETSEEPAESQE